MTHSPLATKLAIARVAGRVVRAKFVRDGRPFIVAHHITNRCMCTCESCLWRRNDWKDVPTDEVKRFYDQAREQGFVAASITGGEPFLRKDLGEIVRHMKKLRMGVLLFTTGNFLEKRMDDVLPWVDVLILSVDSAKAEKHDKIRGLPGLFDRMMRGVQLAKERYPGLTIHFNTCIQQGVEEEIDDLVALAERVGVKISFDVITEFRHGEEGAFTETSMGIPLSALRRVSAYLLWRKRNGAPILNSETYFDYFARGRPGYRCHMPKALMFVDGRGNIEDCLDLTQPIANFRETPLADIMELPRFKELRKDAEGCCSCSSPTMVDLSNAWERPALIFARGGIALG